MKGRLQQFTIGLTSPQADRKVISQVAVELRSSGSEVTVPGAFRPFDPTLIGSRRFRSAQRPCRGSARCRGPARWNTENADELMILTL